MFGQRFRRNTSNIGLDDLGLDDYLNSPGYLEPDDDYIPMVIAMTGSLGVGAILGNQSQEETKSQQLAQMKYI